MGLLMLNQGFRLWHCRVWTVLDDDVALAAIQLLGRHEAVLAVADHQRRSKALGTHPLQREAEQGAAIKQRQELLGMAFPR